MNKPFGLSFFLNDFTVILFESPLFAQSGPSISTCLLL